MIGLIEGIIVRRWHRAVPDNPIDPQAFARIGGEASKPSPSPRENR